MLIQKMNIDDLYPSPYNPRKDLQPGDPDYEKLKKSIKEFDYIDPIIYNIRTGLVVGGHQRLKVLKDLGYTEIDVSVVDLPTEKEKALCIALNKISGEWNKKLLMDLLEELDVGLIDIEITGFSPSDIENLFLPIENGETDPFDEWEGMPEFDGEQDAVRKVIVNFVSFDDYKKFFEVIGQGHSDKTKSIWFPEKERNKLADKRWDDENPE